MSIISFKKIWEDHDEMLQVVLSASNDLVKTSQDFYIYPEELSKFAKELAGYYPRDPASEVILEYGSESENFYAFVKLRIFRKRVNMMCIEVITDNKNEPPELTRAHFFINIHLASVNELGRKLITWLSVKEDKFEYTW